MFANRTEAGRQLAQSLGDHRDPRLLVLGLPRGGVVVAAEVARALDSELDVVLCKKLRAPENPELAIGAVSEGGEVFINADVYEYLDVGKTFLEHEKQIRLDEMSRQVEAYRAVRPKASVFGRPVILVDDGLATGATMMAAIQSTAAGTPRSIVVAVPGGASETAEKIERMREVDEVICLEHPSFFSGVGQLYEDFAQVEDEEVIRLLKTASVSGTA
ncbi:MAG: phosphoribosyltransferase [Verrucomicrobiae bacterium]|nr:phosphoribosyltransferase [Verrucomicrobiae bacterium]